MCSSTVLVDQHANEDSRIDIEINVCIILELSNKKLETGNVNLKQQYTVRAVQTNRSPLNSGLTRIIYQISEIPSMFKEQFFQEIARIMNEYR